MALAFIRRKLNAWKQEKQRQIDEVDGAIWKHYHASRTIDDVERMTGREFEEFLARLLVCMGYTQIRFTPATDQGGDLICTSPEGVRTVIQAKRWKGSVGNSAVQEVLGAMRHYCCKQGIVVTNSSFTSSAFQLVSRGNDVILRDRRWLEEAMNEFLPVSVPTFDRAKFELLLKDFVEITREAAAKATARRKRLPRGAKTLIETLRFGGEAKGKELSRHEVRRLAELFVNMADAEGETRALDRRLVEAQEKVRRLEEEISEIDDALEESDRLSWRNKYN